MDGLKSFIRSQRTLAAKEMLGKAIGVVEEWEDEIPEEISAEWDVNLNPEAMAGFRAGIKCSLDRLRELEKEV